MKHKPILFRRFVLALGVAALASACGQRGALYLPNDVPPEQRSPFPQVVMPGMGTPSTPNPTTTTPPANTATPQKP